MQEEKAGRPDARNTLRITSSGKERHYISYAVGLFEQGQETTIILSAMGSGINKCIAVAEMLKRRVVGLHQWNHIQSVLLEAGNSRPISHMTITLSLAPDTMEQSDSLGYQPPLDPALVQQHASSGAANVGGNVGKTSRSGAGRGAREKAKKSGSGPQQDLRQAAHAQAESGVRDTLAKCSTYASP